jgi:hypothetical protein
MLLSACSGTPSAPDRDSAFVPVASVKQLMEWVIDPAADVIWDSVGTIYTQSGAKERAPRTDEEWAAVRNSALIVAEAGNLLIVPARARDSDKWMAAAHRLTDAANGALKAVEARNVEALFSAGEQIYLACAACHERYAFFDQRPPAQPAK